MRSLFRINRSWLIPIILIGLVLLLLISSYVWDSASATRKSTSQQQGNAQIEKSEDAVPHQAPPKLQSIWSSRVTIDERNRSAQPFLWIDKFCAKLSPEEEDSLLAKTSRSPSSLLGIANQGSPRAKLFVAEALEKDPNNIDVILAAFNYRIINLNDDRLGALSSSNEGMAQFISGLAKLSKSDLQSAEELFRKSIASESFSAEFDSRMSDYSKTVLTESGRTSEMASLRTLYMVGKPSSGILYSIYNIASKPEGQMINENVLALASLLAASQKHSVETSWARFDDVSISTSGERDIFNKAVERFGDEFEMFLSTSSEKYDAELKGDETSENEILKLRDQREFFLEKMTPSERETFIEICAASGEFEALKKIHEIAPDLAKWMERRAE